MPTCVHARVGDVAARPRAAVRAITTPEARWRGFSTAPSPGCSSALLSGACHAVVLVHTRLHCSNMCLCVCTGQQELHRARLKSRCHEVVVLQWSRPRACAVALTHGWRPLHVQRMPTVNVCWKPRLASSCSPPPLRASVSVFLLASQPSCLRPVPAPHCRAMMSVLAYLASALLVGGGCASGEAVIAFDGAAASSTYAGGDFAATEATSKGSGYWCRCVASMHVHGCI